MSSLRWEDGSSAGSAVRGSWGTKVTAVVEAVMALPEGAKCLLFSQWDEMLALLAKALEANGVVHRRLQGALKLEATLDGFRLDPSVRALLLPTRSGANGLNLVEA